MNFWKIISFFGGIIISCMVLILMFFLDLGLFYKLLFIYLISHLIVVFIKLFYFKARPLKVKYKNIFMKIYASSFPSLHAIRVFILAYFLTLYYFNLFFIFYWILAFLVCYSRIILKKHYFIDVLVGGILGLVLSFIIF
jgi:membrane-associated phospholipid phosphatase